MKTLITRTAIAALAAASLAAPSFAAGEFRFDFEYDKVDAETAEGAEGIYDTLLEEVAAHCTVTEFPTRFLNEISTQRCIDRTLDQAVEEIDTAAMDTVHASRAEG